MNFIRTVTIELDVYQSMEKQIAEQDEKLSMFNAIKADKELYYKKVLELIEDNERLCRIVDGLQVQHRNDQGLD